MRLGPWVPLPPALVAGVSLALVGIYRAWGSLSSNPGFPGCPQYRRAQPGQLRSFWFSRRLTHEYVLIFMPALPVSARCWAGGGGPTLSPALDSRCLPFCPSVGARQPQQLPAVQRGWLKGSEGSSLSGRCRWNFEKATELVFLIRNHLLKKL